MSSLSGTVRSRWILAAVSTALFCVQIDYFAMNLALPRMATDLDSNATDLQWVISIYMLAHGAFMVPLSNQIPEILKSVERSAGVISPTWPR